MRFDLSLLKKAKQKQKSIVLCEAAFSERTIAAATIIANKGIAKVVLIGKQNFFETKLKKSVLDKCEIVDMETYPYKDQLLEKLLQLRQNKGLTEDGAKKLLEDPYYFATMLVVCEKAHCLIGGAECSTANMLKPSLQLNKNANGEIVNSYFLMNGKNRLTSNQFVLADCGLLENPTAHELAIIAKRSAEQLNAFCGIDAKVAFLSYSTTGSAKSDDVSKMNEAYNIFKQNNKDISAVGEVQFDSAMIKSVAKKKIKGDADFYGAANALVFPNISAANICYKAISYFANIQAIGPITCGFNKPVNDLSRGCTVDDIVMLAAITVLQCN